MDGPAVKGGKFILADIDTLDGEPVRLGKFIRSLTYLADTKNGAYPVPVKFDESPGIFSFKRGRVDRVMI